MLYKNIIFIVYIANNKNIIYYMNKKNKWNNKN